MTIQQACALALQQHQSGRLIEAEAIYLQILKQVPGHFDALHHLGILSHQTGRYDQAMKLLQLAVTIIPDHLDAQNNLGLVLKDLGRMNEAIAAFQQAVLHHPNIPILHSNLGNALIETGRLDEAVAEFKTAISLNSQSAGAYSNLGNALRQQGKLSEAIAAFRQAISLDPHLAPACNNLGVALRDNDEIDEAIAAIRTAISIAPQFVEAYCNLGDALMENGKSDEAVAAVERAVAVDPDSPEAHWSLGLLRLLRGELEAGWQEYEWRWKCKALTAPLNFPQPQWSGDLLGPRTLLLHAEQGLGDALQFYRYLPLVAQRGSSIIVVCQPELYRLLKTNAGAWQVIPRGEPLPAFDLHCPLMSLPRIFGTRLDSIPAKIPYLQADSSITAEWVEKLRPSTSRTKIGLVWAGGPGHTNDRNRSIPLSSLASLAAIQDADFFSLQKGPGAGQVATTSFGHQLIDHTAQLNDFADTAGLIANLDLVITVDTSVAHLAGAMGKPVWVLLPHHPDWRWLMDREDSPWYPTLRLFRQSKPRDWTGVVAKVVDALSCSEGRAQVPLRVVEIS